MVEAGPAQMERMGDEKADGGALLGGHAGKGIRGEAVPSTQ